MKKIDLGQMITILANVGVIAGIVFLAIELRQNNELLAAQASFAQFSVERDRRTRMIENAGGIADILMAERNGGVLSAVDDFRLRMISSDQLASFQWQFREYRAGRLPGNFIDLATWRTLMRLNPRLVELFERTKGDYDPEFVQFVEQTVIER